MLVTPFLQYFGTVPDPRIDRTKQHLLLDLLVIALCAVICGAEGWEDMEAFGRAKEAFLRDHLGLELPHGIPSHDTFRRVFARLDPDAFGRAFCAWAQALRVPRPGEGIALDGKVLRHSFDTAAGQTPIHLVTAWATQNRLVLGQIKVADKSNEIPAYPALLAMLDLRGCTATIDAMGCQKAVAKQVTQQEGEYVLGLKGNQGTLHENVRLFFEDARAHGFGPIRYRHCRTVEKDHGRIEVREYWLVEQIDWLEEREEWDGLRSIGMVESRRRVGEETSVEVRHFINSVTSVKQFARAVRGHWGIENSEHYILDMAFDEDACRIRRDHGPENFATLRHIALNLLRREPTSRRGVKARLRQAGWDEQYLLRVLTHKN